MQQKKAFILAISGVKNSGKTTLISKLIPLLNARGLLVATIKHDGHGFSADVPGTDTYAHLCAGAYGTAVFSEDKFMLVKKRPLIDERELIASFPEADIILLEGFKASAYPKLELVRQGNSSSSVCPRETLIGLVSDFVPENHEGLCLLDLNDPQAVVDRILAYRYASEQLSMVVLAGGLSRRMGTDKARLDYHGKSFLETQLEKGRQLGIGDILVSGYKGGECSARVIPDRFVQRGPLGGLEASLREACHKRCLVLSVDVPQLPLSEVEKLIEASKKSSKPVTILQHGDWQEPLIGVYDAELAEAMRREITEEKGSVFALLRRVGYDVYHSEGLDAHFQNINDAEAYKSL